MPPWKLPPVIVSEPLLGQLDAIAAAAGNRLTAAGRVSAVTAKERFIHR